MRGTVARVLLFVVLAAFYVAGANEHARVVNTFKARGDQSGYLWDAQNVYANWHGRPRVLIGERNRMPLYAGFLALLYDPSWSNDQFFEAAKQQNIYLSVVLLAVIAALCAHYLPPLPATNLTLIAAFGWFVFKAGYVQAELLFYTLFFAAFLLLWRLLPPRPGGTGVIVAQAVAAGGLAALAHLTKAAVLPLVAAFALVCVADVASRRFADRHASLRPLGAALLVILVFLSVLSPYISTNKRVFGHYFYNVNTTFYVWYDDWPQASIGTIKHGDGVGWPSMSADELPSARRYWREHDIAQIAARVGGGVRDMVNRSYNTYWYAKYVVLYVAASFAIMLKRRAEFSEAVRRHSAKAAFVLVYGLVYFSGIAFYAPISGTGTTRFLAAHLLPLFFVMSRFMTLDPFSDATWRVGAVTVGVQHFHLLVAASLSFDIAFVIWPRLMTTYGGF